MIKQAQVSTTSGMIVNELFKELIINSKTISALRNELESGLRSPAKILKTYYHFIEALHLREQIMEILESEYQVPVTLTRFNSVINVTIN